MRIFIFNIKIHNKCIRKICFKCTLCHFDILSITNLLTSTKNMYSYTFHTLLNASYKCKSRKKYVKDLYKDKKQLCIFYVYTGNQREFLHSRTHV